MSSAVVATGFGGPEVLSLVDVEPDEPGSGEVLVKVRAAGTNPVDYKRYSGSMGRDASLLPMRLGQEISGVVSAVGEGAAGPVGEVSVDDEVIAFRVNGGYAEELVVPGSAVVPKPPNLPFEEASGLMLAGATAIHALSAAGVKSGDTVLLHGASGGVGLMVVQLAVSLGARVIGTASEKNHTFLRELGAEPVPYGPGLVPRVRGLAPDGVSAAIDAVGGDEALDASLELVSDRSRIAELVASPRAFEVGVKVLGGVPGADPGTEIRAAARLQLVEQASAGKLTVFVARAYPLSEVAAAHRELARGHTRGKIVLAP